MSSRKPIRRSETDPVARLVRRDRDDAEEGPAFLLGPGSTDVLAPRTAAQLVDWTIVLPFVFVLDLLIAGVLPFAVRLAVELGIYLAYGAVLEGYRDGQTLGKVLMDLKVVGVDGEECTPRQALVRNLPALVAPLWIPYIVALLSIVTTDLNQRLFDRTAETAVVRT